MLKQPFNVKTIILGANGQLGSDLVKAFRTRGDDVAALTHQDVEISDAAGLERKWESLKPAVVVNTTAFHNVELCESEPETALVVNALAPRHLAEASIKHGFKLIHISTDYVFDGAKGRPYTESDAARPLNCYGNSMERRRAGPKRASILSGRC
jgi:dTDP-4-dehydrorhamnose reductase